MFGFDKLHLDPREANEGSQWRFGMRVKKFERKGYRFPLVTHYAWWIVHNAIAHPMLAAAPIKVSFKFHDWTSRKLNAE